MTFTSSCPVCGHKGIEGEQFDGRTVCPDCYACLEAGHDCHYDPEAGDEWCEDWWEHSGGFDAPAQHHNQPACDCDTRLVTTRRTAGRADVQGSPDDA